MRRQLVLAVALWVACGALLVSPVWATCQVVLTFTSYAEGTTSEESYSYFRTPGIDPSSSESGTSLTGDARGFFWALGFGDPAPYSGHDSGGFVTAEALDSMEPSWLFFERGHPAFVVGTWAAFPTDGCISQTPLPFMEQCMVLAVADQFDGAGYYVLATERVSDFWEFQFHQPDGADIVLAPVPAPVIVERDRLPNGSIVVKLESPPAGDGRYREEDCHKPVVVGYRTRQVRVPAGASPPKDRAIDAGWEVASQSSTLFDDMGPLVAMGDTSRVSLDCSTGEDYFLATSLLFDSGYETPFVSASSTRIACRRCTGGTDHDGDGFCTTSDGDLPRDCDDGDPRVFPWAPQICDGKNNDCRDLAWPRVPNDEIDSDLDGFAECAGDCDDDDPLLGPGVPDLCNGIDDDCSGAADDDAHGTDSDGDGHANACDNCPFTSNAGQQDADADGRGDACDACTDRDADGAGSPPDPSCPGGSIDDCDDTNYATYPGARELFDGRDNDCDGAVDEDLDQDGDGVPRHRDACPDTPQGVGVDRTGCGVCP